MTFLETRASIAALIGWIRGSQMTSKSPDPAWIDVEHRRIELRRVCSKPVPVFTTFAAMDQTFTQAEERLGISLGLAFGPGVVASRMDAFTQMQARGAAATNLLTKAVRRLGDEDVPSADALIARVVATADPDGDPPWDEAQLMLHNAVCDVLEESEEDDASWLERALQVLPDLQGLPRLALEGVLAATAKDYHLRPQERARIRSIVQTTNPCAAVDRLIEEGTIGAVEAMRQILTVVLLYQRTESTTGAGRPPGSAEGEVN